MRSPLVWLTLALLGVAALWWFASSDDHTTAVDESDGATAKAAEKTGVSTKGEERRALTSSEDSRESKSATKKQRTPRPGELTANILVIDAETKKPVPNAPLAVLDHAFTWDAMSDAKRHRIRQFSYDSFAMHADWGYTTRTGDDGRATLPYDGFLAAICEHDGRYGQIDIYARDLAKEHVIELVPASSVRIRVLDAQDKPVAGIGILATQLRGGEPVKFRASFSVAFTDDDGLATLANVNRWLKMPQDQAADRIRLSLDVIGDRRPQHEFSPDSLPDEVLEFRLPPVGTVLVKLRDERGNPLGSYEDTRLTVDGATAHDPTPWHGIPDGPGQTRYPFVALGKVLRATGSPEDDFVAQVTPGPERAGQIVPIEVPVVATGSFLTGRLFDENRRPVGRMMLRMFFEAHGYGGSWFRLITNDDGRFRYRFAEDMVGLKLVSVLGYEFVGVANGRRAFVVESIELSKGRNDLGDLFLADAPTLATGRVLVDGEPPKREIAMHVECHRSGAWQPDQTTGTQWRRDGSFTLRGRGEAERYRLRIVNQEYLRTEFVEFHKGTTGLRIDLQRGGSLVARLQFGGEHLGGSMRLELRAQDRAEPARLGQRPALEAPSARPTWEWYGLRTGRYTLRVFALGSESPIAELRDLIVTLGQRCTDPRLNSIDVTKRLRSVRIQVRDAKDQPIESGMIWSGTGNDRPGVIFGRGEARLWITAPTDLKIAARGYAITTANKVAEDATLVLHKLPVTSVRVPAVVVPEAFAIYVRVEPQLTDLTTVRTHFSSRKVARHLATGQRPFKLGAAREVDVRYRPGTPLKVTAWIADQSDVEDIAEVTPASFVPGKAKVRIRIPKEAIERARARLTARSRRR